MLAAGFLLLLAILEYWVFSGSLDYFWGGFDLFWLGQRFHSAGDFLTALTHADAEGWYRPLSNRLIYSLLYPMFGQDHAGYQSVVLVLFFASSVTAFYFFKEMRLPPFPRYAATLCFALHSVNAYTTFDGSYFPELLYVTFYLCSFIFFLRDSSRLSLLFFVLSLLSKESAITLPFVLLLYCAIYGGRSKRLTPYFVVLLAYAIGAFGVLRVMTGHYLFDF